MGSLARFGEIITPLKFRNRLRRLSKKAGYDTIFDSVALIFFSSIILDIFGALAFVLYIEGYDLGTLLLITILGSLVAFFLIFIIVFLLYILYLDYRIYIRTQKMEETLPDFLALLSENIKSGMTLDIAISKALRPEQGVIYQEMSLVIKNVMTGVDVADALKKFIEMYNSDILKRNFSLIIEAIKGGAKVSEIIDSIIEELKQTKKLRDEMTTSVLSYVIFIAIIVILIAPALFAASKELLILMGNFIEALMRSSSRLPISVKKVNITPDDFTLFSSWSLVVITTFSSLIIGVFKTGRMKDGLKFIPIFIGLGLGVYFLISVLLHNMISGFL